jgi:hypothetical protein
MMGPFKCQDCGIWWAGFEHRCQLVLPSTIAWRDNAPVVTIHSPITQSITMRCTCPPERGDNYLGSCPIHDVQVTLTA